MGKNRINSQFFNSMYSLPEHGLQIVPCTDADDSFDLYAFLTEQKEFVDATSVKVMGGFGAYGNPSSFHHPEIRNLRRGVLQAVRPVLAAAHPNMYLQPLPDRFSLRPRGTTVTSESWHRDATIPYEVFGSSLVAVYGGWMNLNRFSGESQGFSCVPGSHKEMEGFAHGFDKLSKEEASRYKARKVRVDVPAGSCLLFNELTAHEVLPVKQTRDSVRMFVKFVVSTKPLNMFTDLDPLLDAQAVLPYHMNARGMYTFPPMYSASHVNFHGDAITEFSRGVKEIFLERRVAGVHVGKMWVQRVMISLAEAGLMFEPYSEEEKEYFRPSLLLHFV